MKTKEDYILEEVEKLECRKSRTLSSVELKPNLSDSDMIESENAVSLYLTHMNEKIEKLKNLSDDEYQKIIDMNNHIDKILLNNDLTCERLAEMSEEEFEQKCNEIEITQKQVYNSLNRNLKK